jgi:hypothetical protein
MGLESSEADIDALAGALLPGLPVDLIPFMMRPSDLQPFPGGEAWGWPASWVNLEQVVRFPWAGGYHPCLDALIETRSALIGVESKRYEPFRAKQPAPPPGHSDHRRRAPSS